MNLKLKITRFGNIVLLSFVIFLIIEYWGYLLLWEFVVLGVVILILLSNISISSSKKEKGWLSLLLERKALEEKERIENLDKSLEKNINKAKNRDKNRH